MAKIKLALRWNRVKPPLELKTTQDGFIECQTLQNYVCRDDKITKIGGTEEFNDTELRGAIPWCLRSYHKRADGTFNKVFFVFSDGEIYSGDELTGTFTSRVTGFRTDSIPLHATIQVAGNSILYFFSGQDEVYKYDGNTSLDWELTTINEDIGRTTIGGVVHLDRMWYWSKASSTVAYSTTLLPEDFTTDAADIVVGQETDSVIQKIVIGADETMFIFKNNSIWQLYGRTPSTFQFRKVTDKYGLATKRSITAVANGFVFLDEFTRELYFFGGTESSITPLTEKTIRLREIIDETQLDAVCMTVHKGLFRCAFKHTEDNKWADRELIYPIAEPGVDGEPKWSYTKGAKVYSYSNWNQQDDRNKLVSGRSDVGKAMYHERSNNFDGGAIETIVKTGEIVASDDQNVRFSGFWFKGKPGSSVNTVTLNYYLNGRSSDRGTHGLDTKGEVRTIGVITLSQQNLFNNRIVPYMNYSLGNSISFELIDNNVNTTMELYSIAFTAQPRHKIRNAYVGN